MTYQPDLNQAIDDLKNQLVRWRCSNKAPKPIPPDIWAKATQLAVVHGIGRISQSLRLDYASLKRRVGRDDLAKPTLPPTFFEFMAPSPSAIGPCTLEVETPGGSKLKVELKDVSAANLGELLKNFSAQP